MRRLDPIGAPPAQVFALVSVALMAAHALIFAQSSFVALGLVWLGLLAAARAGARKRFASLEIRRELPDGAHEGDTLALTLELENRGRHPVLAPTVVDHFGPEFHADRLLLMPGPIAPGAGRRLRYYGHCTMHWGTYPVGPLRLAVSDALGLSQIVESRGEGRLFPLFPRIVPLEGLLRHGARSGGGVGLSTTGYPGQSRVDLGLRDYRAGDDPRTIHWRATARVGTLMVREFEAELQPCYALLLDLDRRNRAGIGRRATLDSLVRIGASLLAGAARRGHLVQLFASGRQTLAVPLGHGEGHLAAALEHLVRLRQDGERPFPELVTQCLPSLPPGSTAALLWSDATPPLAEVQHLSDLLEAHGVRPFFVFVDKHSFMAIDVPLTEAPLPAQAAAWAAEIDAFLEGRGVPYARFCAGDDLSAGWDLALSRSAAGERTKAAR